MCSQFSVACQFHSIFNVDLSLVSFVGPLFETCPCFIQLLHQISLYYSVPNPRKNPSKMASQSSINDDSAASQSELAALATMFVELTAEADATTLDLLSTALDLSAPTDEPRHSIFANLINRCVSSDNVALKSVLEACLASTFHSPTWLFSSGLRFLHSNDPAAPLDVHHNLIALWTKNCICSLGMLDLDTEEKEARKRLLLHMLPAGRARRFLSLPLVQPVFGPGTRKAGQPTADRMAFMANGLANALHEMPSNRSRQLVVIGSGFDPISLRAAQLALGIKAFEMDLPNVVQNKAAMLKRLGEELGEFGVDAMPTLIPIDLLQTDPIEALVNASLTSISIAAAPDTSALKWNPNIPSLIVIEAVLGYLPDPFKKSILESVARAINKTPGSGLLIWDSIYSEPKEGEGPEETSRRTLEELGLRVVEIRSEVQGFVMARAVCGNP